jgi:predicted metal-dependent phosphoesterase TrpH
MTQNIDLHLHTTVSDGEVTPMDLIRCARELGLEKISITDHDAVGAYRNYGYDPVKEAKQLGVQLIPGIELDSYYKDVEIHVLGYGIDTEYRELNDYLTEVQQLRKKRLAEQIKQVNAALDFDIEEDEGPIIDDIRDTVMNPHLVRPLLNRGLFKEYREAAQWVQEHTNSSVLIPKPTTCEMIKMIQSAGGEAFIAHPGYYVEESGLDLDTMVKDFNNCGIAGIEIIFPYYQTSPKFDTLEREAAFFKRLHQVADTFQLKTSKGSDAHDLEKMRRFADRFHNF